jgi:hypothetical protein
MAIRPISFSPSFCRIDLGFLPEMQKVRHGLLTVDAAGLAQRFPLCAV